MQTTGVSIDPQGTPIIGEPELVVPKDQLVSITQQFVSTLRPPLTGEATFWDAQHPDFGLRIAATGKAVFLLRLDRKVRPLGSCHSMSVLTARERAGLNLPEVPRHKGLILPVVKSEQRRTRRALQRQREEFERLTGGSVPEAGGMTSDRTVKEEEALRAIAKLRHDMFPRKPRQSDLGNYLQVTRTWAGALTRSLVELGYVKGPEPGYVRLQGLDLTDEGWLEVDMDPPAEPVGVEVELDPGQLSPIPQDFDYTPQPTPPELLNSPRKLDLLYFWAGVHDDCGEFPQAVEAAEFLQISGSAVSQHLRALVGLGYLYQQGPRGIYSLTTQGWALVGGNPRAAEA